MSTQTFDFTGRASIFSVVRKIMLKFLLLVIFKFSILAGSTYAFEITVNELRLDVEIDGELIGTVFIPETGKGKREFDYYITTTSDGFKQGVGARVEVFSKKLESSKYELNIDLDYVSFDGDEKVGEEFYLVRMPIFNYLRCEYKKVELELNTKVQIPESSLSFELTNFSPPENR